jgi:protocatechuate 3,4-dioxygenase beta subunit
MISTRQTIACFLLIASVTACSYAQANPPKDLTSTISGKVTVLGNAVAGVVITLRSNEPGSKRNLMDQRGITNSKGEYRITNVPPGNYTVAPVADSFIVATGEAERPVMVSKAETIEDLDFSLMPGGVITGKVVDPDGRPVIEEEVHLFPEQRQGAFSVRPAAMTDDRGIYRIFGLKPGGYRIAAGRDNEDGGRRTVGAHARTYYPGIEDFAQAAVIPVAEGTEVANVDITLNRMLTTHTASGRVVNGETGEPVPNVKYSYRRFGNSGVNRGNMGATNERGEFKFESLVPGQYAFVVWADPGSYVRVEELRFEVVDQDVTGLVVKTIKDASLSGVMVLEGTHDQEVREKFLKMPLVAFVETEASRKGGGTLGVSAEMEPNGRFRIGGLPAGTATFGFGAAPTFHIIRVERDGIIHRRGFEVREAESVTGIRIVAAYANASLRGVIEVENGPLPANARLYLSATRLNTEYSGINPPVEIDARGHFKIDAMVPGTYEISTGVFITGSGPRIFKRQRLVVIPGPTGNLTIKIDLNAPQPKP